MCFEKYAKYFIFYFSEYFMSRKYVSYVRTPTLFSNTNIITVIEYSENERSHWFPKSCGSQGAMSVQARVCYRWSPA